MNKKVGRPLEFPDRVMMNFYADRKFRDKFKALAKEKGTNISELTRQLIENYMAGHGR